MKNLSKRPSHLDFSSPFLSLTKPVDMNYTNPYAQAGWCNPENPSAINQFSGPTSQPPTFGALPYPGHSAPPTKRFIFSSQGPELIRGCEVIDSDSGLTAFRIKMGHEGYDYTSLQCPSGTPRGYIVWKPQGPETEVYGTVARQKAKDWLPLSPDKRY
ncbi:hypothetical protein Agabi119p4_9023 [Agaricus bisporus var. burnettii]|uniref:Uncharacterized protein n=1 Tax=Agaricus bisporus var. burnettii TaxID=192524 RepID=A0A8H7EY93_AGABI|nr:hypothetical protein Agabi119p4_9023 [Agaricus bisporus var. burnettii]